MTRHTPRAARALLVAAAVLFSTGGAVIKSTSLSGWQIAGLRSGVAAVSVLLMLPEARRARLLWQPSTIAIGAAYAATMILFVQANKLTTAANAIFLQSTAPLYLVILGPVLLREPARRRDLVFMAVMAAGLALFFLGSVPPTSTAPRPLEGNIAALLSGLFWATTVGGLRWLNTSGASAGTPAAAVAMGNVLAFLVCLPWALPAPSPDGRDVAAVLYLGVFQIAIAYVCLTSALRHIPAFEASLLLLVEPVLNPLWAWLVHGERPGAWALCGGAIIVVATALKARDD